MVDQLSHRFEECAARLPRLSEKSFIEECATNDFRILLTHALGTNDVVPGRAYPRAHVRNDCSRLLLIQKKARALREKMAKAYGNPKLDGQANWSGTS
jgi:hypothetical protein